MIAAALLALALVPRAPETRQAIADLAYSLGEVHALAQACRAGDQAWRDRMNQLIAVEAAEPAFRRRLIDSFNAGFTSAKAEHAACDGETARARAAAAERGRGISDRLGTGAF